MKYLVVQTKQMGDVLISTALCNNLKQHDPGWESSLSGHGLLRGHGRGNPQHRSIDRHREGAPQRVAHMKDLLLGIRRERYDVVINSQGQMIGLLTCSSGARLRIGFDLPMAPQLHRALSP